VRRFTVVTLFPELIEAFGATGIVRRAQDSGLMILTSINPRTFSENGTGRVDDSPYGGGPGMVMKVPAIRAAITVARQGAPAVVAYLTPQGVPIDQLVLSNLCKHEHLVLVAGRYEGIDERIVERDIDIELSLGDFVLSGGEIAAMAVIDGITRLIPGALGSELSAASDSFSDGLLEHPQFTRPEIVDDQRVPGVLLSGNHEEIARWRHKQALQRTLERRPDLIKAACLNEEDELLLAEIVREISE
jgi:tRNA (guanine37-N1)-methyltransferase